MADVEVEIQKVLDKKEELKQDKYQCTICGSLITIQEGEIPEICPEGQGGCGKKHKKFTLITDEGQIAEIQKKKSKEEIKKEKLDEAKKKAEEADYELKHAEIDALQSSCYTEMDNYVGMVKVGASYGTIIEGRGGTGKTWRVIQALQDCEYSYTDSYTTPQALYCWLYANRNKDVLVVDDVAGFMDNAKVLAFLKGGLWHVGKSQNRIIHYMTSKPLQDEEGNFVPNAFILSARMIIITNKLNRKNPHLNAILSRVNYCRVEIDYEELINILEQVMQKDYPNLTLDERKEVFDFIKENTSESNDSMNIRTLIKCFQQKVYSNRIKKPELWKHLAMLSLLEKNPALIVIEELVNDPKYETEEDRVIEFKSRTGRSRATYFRLKEELKQVGDKLKA
jgi:hypothetical protein